MPDMYDKLGEMLNEALKSGKIPTDRHCEADASRHCEAEGRSNPSEKQNDQVTSDEKIKESGHFSFNKSEKSTVNNKKSAEKTNNRHFKTADRSKPTGQVIKLHKYTYNMQFPPHIQKALGTLDIVYPFTVKDIKKQYHKLLKENHPDTQNTIQTSQVVKNIKHKTIGEITDAYKILCDFFGIR